MPSNLGYVIQLHQAAACAFLGCGQPAWAAITLEGAGPASYLPICAHCVGVIWNEVRKLETQRQPESVPSAA